MRGLERRLARLESRREAQELALVSPETLEKMAAVIEAQRARIREKLLGDGPHVPALRQPGVESEARARLREKLLRDDPGPAESARA
jgi:hypothetical protein